MFHDPEGCHSNRNVDCTITDFAFCGLVAAVGATKRPMGDLLTEAVEQFLMPIVGDWSDETRPLPPLRAVPDFRSPTVDEIADLPCGVSTVEYSLQTWEKEWTLSDAFLLFNLRAITWHETLRHHPAFREHAAALAEMLEGHRKLSALLTPTMPEKQP